MSKHYKNTRNSSIELLRIIATYLIILRHFVVFNTFDVWSQTLSIKKVVLEGIFYPSGKIGVVLFFLISAWFLCESPTSLKESFKRLWFLEREVLFYSIALFGFFCLFQHAQINTQLVLNTIFPISTNLWWYATSYAVFLILMPFFTKGLQTLGKQTHKACCLICIIMWSICGGIFNFISFDMPEQNVLIFLYLYTLVSYWRWYIKDPIQTKISILAITAGYAITTVSVIFLSFTNFGTQNDPSLQGMLGRNEWMLPVMLASFGTFALFKEHHFVNKIINSIAKSMFAVYLITVYPLSSTLLWQKLFNISNIYNSRALVPFIIIAGLFILTSCICIDYLRRWIFRITIDCNKGRWFDYAWEKLHSICRKTHITETNIP